jgi:hypothetical protein
MRKPSVLSPSFTPEIFAGALQVSATLHFPGTYLKPANVDPFKAIRYQIPRRLIQCGRVNLNMDGGFWGIYASAECLGLVYFET